MNRSLASIALLAATAGLTVLSVASQAAAQESPAPATAPAGSPPPAPEPSSPPPPADAPSSPPPVSAEANAPSPPEARPAGASAGSSSGSASGSSDSGESAEAPTAPAGDDWPTRDRDANESNAVNGGVGLLHMQHAESGSPGQFRLGFVGEWFSAGFLCTTKFACPNPNGGAALTSDSMNHVGGTLSLGVSIAKLGPGVLEAYGATSAYANSDTANRPEILQVLGDTDLALKYAAPIGNVMHLGLFTELWLINASGSVGLDGGGTSARFGGAATADLRGLQSHIPLRFSLNLVYSLDNTGDVLNTIESQNGPAHGVSHWPVTRIDRYGLGINRVDHVDLMLGAEAMLLDERIRPFLEARVLIPSNRQKYVCEPNNQSGDLCLKEDQVAPSTLTIGARFFPWKRGFSLLAALDIGLSGTSNFIEELQPVAPWTLFFGGGWTVDTWDRPPVVKTVEVEKAAKGPALVHVVGTVHEKDKNAPIAGAIATYRDHADLSPLATAGDGRFSDDVPVGQYTFDVKADGYRPGSCDVQAAKVGTEADVDCALEALPRFGTVTGHVRDAVNNQGVGGVQVVVSDGAKKELRLTTDASGGFHFDGVTPGNAELSVIADGYLAFVSPVEVKPRQDSAVDLMLRPVPKQPKVQISGKEIMIKDQIQFALDSAVILPQSFGLLTEVADTLIRHGEIHRVEVQGHTDNSGTPEHNVTLSEERAEAVSAWLVQHGVAADRLTAHGFGQEKPLVPNVTAANRAKNRRVQFIIVDRGDAGAASAGAAPAGPAPAGAAPPPRKPNPLPGF